MSSTTTDSQDSVIFVCEQHIIHVEVHPRPSQNPQTPPENQNTNQNTPTSGQITGLEEEENDCFIVPETGKNILKYTHIKQQ